MWFDGIHTMTIKCFFALVVLSIPLFTAARVHAAVTSSDVDSLPYFYQRTIYMENLCQPGSWWSNPSMIAGIDKISLFTSSSGLIGRRYSLSSVRFIFPVKPSLNCGIGITGSGTYEGRSLTSTGSSVQSSSNFSFKRPSLEGGVSYVPPFGGTVGALIISGTESIGSSYDTTSNLYFFFGIGTGWLSPAIMNTVRLSVSTLSIRHLQIPPWWDNSAKIGMQVNVDSGLVLGALEYGFALGTPITFFQNENTTNYEVIRGLASIRVQKIVGILLGYSLDTPNFSDNGHTFHAGIELRRSEIYPYYGGYEAGLSTSNHLAFIHRIWVGYGFQKKQAQP
jgi:hypothetical protein